jgi:phosphomannomutase
MNLLVDEDKTLSELKDKYPKYAIIKHKFDIEPDTDISALLKVVKNKYINERINEEDGLKIDFDNGWVHLRESNTEPIIRVIAESNSEEEAQNIINNMLDIVNENR